MTIKQIFAAVSAAAYLYAGSAVAADPPGTPGQDWARKDIEIRDGLSVRVTGSNQTVNVGPDNSSSVNIMVNNVSKLNQTVQAALISRSVDLSGDGKYTINVICSNTKADAGTCAVNVEKIGPEVFRK